MVEAKRTFEIERPIEAVWKAYTDFECWASWFDLNFIVVSRNHRFFWQGTPGPGAAITVEVNGRRGLEWLAKEWDPPLRARIVGTLPGPAAFAMGLSLTRQTDVSTVVDLKLGVQPLGRLVALTVTSFFLRRKLDQIVASANQRILAEAA